LVVGESHPKDDLECGTLIKLQGAVAQADGLRGGRDTIVARIAERRLSQTAKEKTASSLSACSLSPLALTFIFG